MQSTLELKINKLLSFNVLHKTKTGKYKLATDYLHGRDKAFNYLKDRLPEEYTWIRSFESPQAFHYCINNDIEFTPVCSVCGKPLALHTNNGTYYYSRTCSEACRIKQIELTNKENHNGVWNFQTPEFNDLTKKTSLERYGCEDPAQTLETKKKRSNTRIIGIKKEKSLHGTRSPQKDNLTRRSWDNVDIYTQPEEVKIKRKETCLKKYGCENANQAKEVRDKSKQTCLERYGIPDTCTFRVQLLYENTPFDSYPELAVFIYFKDQNIQVERNPNIKLEYFDIEKQKLRRYYPDFKINGELIEIKSHYWWGRETDSYKKFVNSVSKILFEDEYNKYIDYVKKTYGSNYMKQFKVIKE